MSDEEQLAAVESTEGAQLPAHAPAGLPVHGPKQERRQLHVARRSGAIKHAKASAEAER